MVVFTISYIYQYRDHLGNARVSFAKNSEGVFEVTDTNNYYPFGLNHIEGMLSSSNFGGYYSYKYNGKELQETGMYDYGARFYMPDIGRWGVVDELAEKSRRFSPFTYPPLPHDCIVWYSYRLSCALAIYKKVLLEM